MKKYIFAILIALIICTTNTYSQNINGHVFSKENGKMVGLTSVTVFFPGTTHATTTAEDGSFEIKKQETDPLKLAFSLVGYNPDTVELTGKDQHIMLEMKPNTELEEVVAVGYQTGTLNSRMSLFRTETITKTGLAKLACCNLSESFENSATVTVGFTDAVSGAKQIQLLGLSGLYVQMMSENIPTMRGLAQTFGWNYIPGAWLESIQVSKGASSVLNGYESISGQINLEFKKPHTAEPLFINLFANATGRYEANVTSAVPLSDKWSMGLLGHYSTETVEHDYNKDSFMDKPTSQLVNLYNRWDYQSLGDDGLHSQTGLKFLYDKRHGGQTKHGNEQSNHLFGSHITNKNFTVENKTGAYVGLDNNSSVGFINAFTHYEQEAEIGMKTFGGKQNNYYSNLLFSSEIGENQVHKYTVGASFLYDNLQSHFLEETGLDKTEIVPGVFGEYTFAPTEKFTAVLGFRTDYNSRYGWLATPRINLKYDFNQYVTARASAGRGFHSPNVIFENIGLMASSRMVDVSNINDLDIEKAWNFGGNLQFSIPVSDKNHLSLGFDYFHTNFENQIIADMEFGRNNLYFYNLQGRSFADVWQMDLTYSPFTRFDIYAAFRYNNTQITYTDGNKQYTKEKPLTSRYRGLVNLAYATPLRKWVFDFTTQLNGQNRLPNLDGYEGKSEYSPVYPMIYAQVTKNTKRFDVYLGVENLTNYRQKNPIIEPENPFGKNFDSSRIWGPLMGREVYLGVRIRIGELK
ncbi:MAG: TonB-dependent receptor [Tannerella sp.]|jgi:outer membrane receptor for ferrienterochelin and colicin|nr:TonB-dependent receptor [Tannerella sp.]